MMKIQRLGVTGLCILGVGILLIALVPLFPSYWISLITETLIYGIMAMSLNILLGYTGLPPFGHAGYFGISAYVVGILSTRFAAGFWLSSFCAVFLSTGTAAIFGLIVAHSSGVYFLMITFALGMCLWGLAFRWASVTGGDNGISGIPRPDIGLPIDLSNSLTFYYFTLVVFILVFVCLYVFIQSPFGLSIKGIRESESRMRTLSYNTWLHKYLSYVTAGAFAGIAGILWAYHNNYVSPTDLDMMACIKPFLMVILGGAGTMIGPVIGSGIITFLEHFISSFTERWLIIQGVIFIIIVFYAPKGLVDLASNILKPKKQSNTLDGVKRR
jgi:branched-chain amino acid transport system permease protein